MDQVLEHGDSETNANVHEVSITPMMRLVVTAQAVDDLVRLKTFVDAMHPSAAASMISSLLDTIEHVHRFPGMGKRVDHGSGTDEIRDFVTTDHIVRYVVGKEMVMILRVWHHREDR